MNVIKIFGLIFVASAVAVGSGIAFDISELAIIGSICVLASAGVLAYIYWMNR